MKKVFLGLSLTLATSLFSAETNNSATNQANGKILIENMIAPLVIILWGEKMLLLLWGLLEKI